MPRDCRTKNSENERYAKAKIADEGECTYHADLHKGAKPQEDEGDPGNRCGGANASPLLRTGE
jgi:hypothetical protein